MDVLSNNLANVETNGYKADSPAFRTYEGNLQDKTGAENHRSEVKSIGRVEQALIVDEVRTLFTEELEQTNVGTHLAIDGTGFCGE